MELPSRFRGALLGPARGDAVCTTVEFKPLRRGRQAILECMRPGTRSSIKRDR